MIPGRSQSGPYMIPGRSYEALSLTMYLEQPLNVKVHGDDR